MTESAEQPKAPQPLRTLAFVRGGVWLAVLAAVLGLYRSDAPWALRAAAFAVIYSAVTAAVPYPRHHLAARIFDLFVDVVCSSIIVRTNHADLNPFIPLFFLTTLEGQALFGFPGAIAVSFISVSNAYTSLGPVGEAVLLGSLLIHAAIVHRLGLPRPKRDTLMPERTVEDVEMLVEAVEDQNRQLRQTHKEMTSAVRRAQSGTEEAAARYQLLSASLEETDIDAAYRAVLDVIKDHFDAGSGAIWALDYRGERLEVRSFAGPVSPVVQTAPIPVTAGTQPSAVRKIAEQRLRMAVPERRSGAGRPEEKEGIVDPNTDRADVIAVALRAGDKIVGALALGGAKEGQFSEGEGARLGGLSVAAGLAVRTVEQRTSLQRGIREISILHEMNLLVQNTSDLDQIYEQIVSLVGNMIPFENCTVFRYLPEQKQLLPVATRGRQINLMEHVPFEHGTGISAYVAAHRKQIFIADLTKEPGVLNAEMMPPRVRSFISVPMAVRDHLIGVINVSHSQANAFTPVEARVLSLLAGQAAMTVEREEMVRSLEQLAITDGLTGIFNHRYFQMRLENEVKRAARYKLPFALLMIDLDHFKNINDRYGHATGDQVLAEVASLLKRSVRETDITARYGGEEFTIILTQTALADAVLTADRLRKTIAEYTYETAEGVPLQVTVSIGVAAFPDHGSSREGLLQASDRALYAAKNAGRNRVEGA